MSAEQYLTYQRFSDKAAATELNDLLIQNNIDSLLEDSSVSFDATFSNSELTKEYRIKLKKEDFEAADKLLTHLYTNEIENIGKDYYLFEFTDAELIEIVTKPDEWNHFDYLLAQKILKEKGKGLDQENTENLKRQRIEELSKPDESQTGLVVFGYISAFLGGLVGIFIGWHLNTSKKTLPNGEQVYSYSERDRKSGNNIFKIGIIAFILWILVRVMDLI